MVLLCLYVGLTYFFSGHLSLNDFQLGLFLFKDKYLNGAFFEEQTARLSPISIVQTTIKTNRAQKT